MWTSKNRARYDRSKLRYPSDLTDDEWGLVEPLIPPGKTGGGKRTVIMREVVKSDIRLFFHTALTREAARSRPARLKWPHLLNTSATTLRRYSLNILKELGKV